MSRKVTVFTNICIATTLLVLTLVVFMVDITAIYLTVSAPLYSGNRDRNNVSFMINVHGGEEYVTPIMEVLESKDVGATWFLSGNWVTRNMQTARDIADRFEIGNHAFSHRDMRNMRESDQHAEMQNAREVIKSVTGEHTSLFAPPFGSFGRSTLRVADRLNYTTIMWSRDTIDWRDTDPDLIFNRATRNVRNGDLVLIHPTAHTLLALPHIIDYYLSNGFNIVPVSRNIA